MRQIESTSCMPENWLSRAARAMSMATRHHTRSVCCAPFPAWTNHAKPHCTPSADLPDLMPQPGCAFAPRCQYAIDHCRTEVPPLMPVAADHLSACWVAAQLGREAQR